MSTILLDIFWFIVTFSILVILHEGGHFLVARLFGVHVHEFMIGLPGPGIRFHGKKTDYGVTMVPLGGYVRISGMEPGPEDARLEAVLAYVTRRRNVRTEELALDLGLDLADADALLETLVDWNAIRRDPDSEDAYIAACPAEKADDPKALLDLARSTTYRGLSAVKRILVLSAGVVVNLISAVLVFVLVLTIVGLPVETLTVTLLSPGGGAQKAGIRTGETITAIDGKKVADWEALTAAITRRRPGDVVRVTLAEPNGGSRAVSVTLGSQDGRTLLGVQGGSRNVPLSVPAATQMSFGLVGQVFQAIAGFFNPHTFQRSVAGSTGVVGIAVLAGQEAQRGPIDFAFFIALLSLSLGAMNILPIPPLDGGKVALEIIEAIRRRPLPRNVALGISLAGTVLLVALIGYLMYADITRIVMHGG
jgi:regulator of sigma E protease